MDQSLIHTLRKKSETISHNFNCKRCGRPLEINKTYSIPVDLEIQPHSPQDLSGLYCGKCKDLISYKFFQVSEELKKIQEFFHVPCTKHPQNKADYYFKSTFQPVCSDCQYPSSVNKCKIVYKSIENDFFLLYKKWEKSLCKDRKKALVSYNTLQLLQACSWINQIEFGPVCKIHPWNFCICLDPHLNTYCNLCEQSVNYKFYFTDVQKVIDIILEAAKDKSRNSRNDTLNFYMIKTVWISSRPYSRKDWEINLMLLETQDLLAEKTYDKVRCVNCLKTIRCGIRQGIPLECGHTFCFNCVFSPDNDKCPLDYVPIKYSEYLDNFQASVNQCHAIHSLGGMKAFKLPCFHYSCSEHLGLGWCLVCGFEFSLWPGSIKESMKNMKLNEFLMIRCLAHNLEVSCFEVFPARFFCEKCSNLENKVPLNGNLSFVYSLFDSLYSVFIEKIMEKNLEIKNLNFWRLGTYLKLVCNQKKLLFLGVIETYLNYCKLNPTKQILFFSKLIPTIRSTTKFLKIPNKSEIIVKITPNEDLILSSLLVANQYFLMPEYSYPAIINSVTIKVYSKEKNELNGEQMKLLAYYEEADKVSGKEYREYFLSNSVFLSEIFWFEISIEINPGEYFFGKPLSRTKNKEFSLEFVSEKEVVKNIGKFGGPFIGIGVFQLSLL